MDLLELSERREHWWKVFVLIFAVSLLVVGYVGYRTYEGAPPIADFVDDQGHVVFSGNDVVRGQQVFFRYGLMDYGSFLGDGGLRGPDFTAEALNVTVHAMQTFVGSQLASSVADPTLRERVAQSVVQSDVKTNRYDAAYYSRRGEAEHTAPNPGAVVLTAAQAHAFETVKTYYAEKFGAGGTTVGSEAFTPANYITDPEQVRQLSAFFFWGGWLCAVARPGHAYSYTHNWPYDPAAGNTPHGGLLLWSLIGVLAVVVGIGVMFVVYGAMERRARLDDDRVAPFAASAMVDGFRPTPTQRAAYHYFALAAILFAVQVLAGLLAIGDFINLFHYVGIDISSVLPVTIPRAWHAQISVLWIAICWFAATIWVLPLLGGPEPSGQLAWVNGLLWMLVTVALGAAVGIPLAIMGAFDGSGLWRWFGLQGWEFMEIGRAYQYVLYAAFIVWFVIVVRGLWPVLRLRQSWSLPNWIVYTIAGVILMFSAAFVAGPETNFVIADFWRWMTIHMWVEAFFELFTTIIVGYFLYLMGFVTHAAVARVVYFGAVLFLGSGLIGISHNFYWNGKSIEAVALGGVLSSLQVAPLVLLTIEAWRFRGLPDESLATVRRTQPDARFGLADAFLFLVGVNFWNFYGAGVLGFSINLPIVNYYEHGTYLTVNHGHAALFGVYGNLAIAAMLFCGRWSVAPERWNSRLVQASFWSLNVGLVLMVLMDLFPVGVHQLMVVLSDGYAAARSQAYLHGTVFQTFTWLRGVGVALFIVGGVCPLVWFIVSRWFSLKPATSTEDAEPVPASALTEPS